MHGSMSRVAKRRRRGADLSVTGLIVCLVVLALSSLALARYQDRISGDGAAPFAKDVERAPVVRLTAIANGAPIAEGTGFFVRHDLIATTYQLVKDGLLFRVQRDGERPMTASLVGVDQNRSVALLTTDHASATEFKVRYEHDLKPGDELHVPIPRGTTVVKCRLGEDGKSVVLEQLAVGLSEGAPVLNKWGEVIGLAELAGGGLRIIRISALADAGAIVTAGSPPEVKDQVEARKGGVESQTASVFAGEDDQNSPTAEPAVYPQTAVHLKALPPASNRAPGAEVAPGSEAAARPPVLAVPSVIRRTSIELRQSMLREAEPLYPHRAKVANISGRVLVEIAVDKLGYVTLARALRGPRILRQPAIAAAMAHLFSPAKVDGQPVEVVGTLSFTFRVQGSIQPSGATRISPADPIPPRKK